MLNWISIIEWLPTQEWNYLIAIGTNVDYGRYIDGRFQVYDDMWVYVNDCMDAYIYVDPPPIDLPRKRFVMLDAKSANDKFRKLQASIQ